MPYAIRHQQSLASRGLDVMMRLVTWDTAVLLRSYLGPANATAERMVSLQDFRELIF